MITDTMTEDTMWTARDVARFLKVSISFVYKAAAGGRLPCRPVGALVRFDPAAIRAWALGKHERGVR